MVKIYIKRDFSYCLMEIIEDTFRLKNINYKKIVSINEIILRVDYGNNYISDMIWRKIK